MRTSFPRCAANGFILSFVLILGVATAANNNKPILISQVATTRALAFESVTMKA